MSGRKAIFEALIVDDEVKIAIQERAPALQLQRILERRGEASLLEKAVREAAAGVISLEEACKFREVGSTVSLEQVTMAIRHLAKRLETDKALARKVKTRGDNVVC